MSANLEDIGTIRMMECFLKVRFIALVLYVEVKTSAEGTLKRGKKLGQKIVSKTRLNGMNSYKLIYLLIFKKIFVIIYT